MIKVSNEVRVYEVDGQESGGEPVVIEAHWNRCALVRIKRGNQDFTVVAKDLLAAIANATNTARF